MATAKQVIYIRKENGKLIHASREILKEAIEEIPDGQARIVIEAGAKPYTKTRYKYYFAHVLETILLTCGQRFEILDGEKFRPARDVEEIHEALKMKYNPVIVRTPFGAYTMPASTRNLSDRDFIEAYEEQIISEFAAYPFGCDFMTREEWAEQMKQKAEQWQQ